LKQIGCDSKLAHNPWVEGLSPTGPKDKPPCDAEMFVFGNIYISTVNQI